MNWKSKIDIKDIWNKRLSNEITLVELAKELSNKLEEVNEDVFNNDFLEEMIEEFRAIDNESTDDDFNDLLNILYDWADHDKRLWIGTF